MRVLELGDQVSAAYAGKLFARWGAEVIRVERPRASGSAADPLAARSLDRYLHGGKQRVAIDYHAPEGRALLGRLAEQSDVLLTDEPAAVVDELELLSLGNERAPALRVSITPFGLSGPYRDWQAVPATLLALGGHTYLMGDRGRAPLTMPGHYPQYQAGQYAYTAALAAHIARLRDPSGPPQTIEISVLETLVSLHQYTTVMWTYAERQRSRHGNRWENSHPITLLPCRDGEVGFSVTLQFWEPFAHLIGHPELVDDPRFATSEARLEHADELDEIAIEALANRTPREVMTEGQETWRVPVGGALSMRELLDDPHLNERGFWQRSDDRGGAAIRIAGSPFRYAGEELPAEPAAAEPGADTVDVLDRLTRPNGGA